MSEYFSPANRCVRVIREAPGPDVPITPKKKKWEHLEDPEALRRAFKFSSTQNLMHFLEDVIQMQEILGHHGKLLVDQNRVTAQITTHIINSVTEMDVEWAVKVDEIYEDIERSE